MIEHAKDKVISLYFDIIFTLLPLNAVAEMSGIKQNQSKASETSEKSPSSWLVGVYYLI